MKVLGAGEDLDFDSHEINRQVPPVNLGKADGVLLRRNDRDRLALLAAINCVQDFLLSEAVMIRETFAVDE
jgi:hypothetical protein